MISQVDVSNIKHRSLKCGPIVDSVVNLGANASVCQFKKYTVIAVTTTKALVDYLVSLNTHNRKTRVSQVNRIAEDMARNDFIFTAQGIGINEQGVISDGQHRLFGNIQAGYPPIDIIIVTGLSPAAQSVVDQQARRSVADALSFLMNTTVTTRAVAAINILNVTSGLTEAGRPIRWSETKCTGASVARLQELYLEWLDYLAIPAGLDSKAPITAPIMAFAKLFSLEKAMEFVSSFKTGANLSEDSPVLRLRNASKGNTSSTAYDKMRMIRLTVSACKAFNENRLIKQLRESDAW